MSDFSFSTFQMLLDLETKLGTKGEILNVQIPVVDNHGTVTNLKPVATTEGAMPQTKFQAILRYCAAFDACVFPTLITAPYPNTVVPMQVTVGRLAGPDNPGITAAQNTNWMSFDDALTFCGVAK